MVYFSGCKNGFSARAAFEKMKRATVNQRFAGRGTSLSHIYPASVPNAFRMCHFAAYPRGEIRGRHGDVRY